MSQPLPAGLAMRAPTGPWILEIQHDRFGIIERRVNEWCVCKPLGYKYAKRNPLMLEAIAEWRVPSIVIDSETLCFWGVHHDYDKLWTHHDQAKLFRRFRPANGCSMRRSGNGSDNAAMYFFSSLKTERTARKMYRTRDEARADVFDYIERFYNPKRRHSTIGYMSPMEFERQAGLA
jgi:putative transposase